MDTACNIHTRDWTCLEISLFSVFSRHRDTSIDTSDRRALAGLHEPIRAVLEVLAPMLLLGVGLTSRAAGSLRSSRQGYSEWLVLGMNGPERKPRKS